MMAKLILSLNNTFVNEIFLDKQRMTIGRKSTNDIKLDHSAVSGEHAVILKIDNDFYVEDLGSTNGTLVNSQAIKRHLLQHADTLQLGKYQLKYINEATSSNVDVKVGETDFKMIKPSAMKAVEPTAEQASTPATSLPSANFAINSIATTIGRIQVLNGSNVGHELILNKTLTTLGKVDVQVAVITKRPNGYFITHVEGKMFPSINGASTGAQAVALTDHDVIELAGVKMEFYLDNT